MARKACAAALRARKEKPGPSDPTERPCLFSQTPPAFAAFVASGTCNRYVAGAAELSLLMVCPDRSTRVEQFCRLGLSELLDAENPIWTQPQQPDPHPQPTSQQQRQSPPQRQPSPRQSPPPALSRGGSSCADAPSSAGGAPPLTKVRLACPLALQSAPHRRGCALASHRSVGKPHSAPSDGRISSLAPAWPRACPLLGPSPSTHRPPKPPLPTPLTQAVSLPPDALLRRTGLMASGPPPPIMGTQESSISEVEGDWDRDDLDDEDDEDDAEEDEGDEVP